MGASRQLCECSDWLLLLLLSPSLLSSLLFSMLSSSFLMLLFVVKPLHGGSCPTRTRAADLLSLSQEIRLLVQRFRPKGGSAPLGRLWEGRGCSCSELGCLLAHPSQLHSGSCRSQDHTFLFYVWKTFPFFSHWKKNQTCFRKKSACLFFEHRQQIS